MFKKKNKTEDEIVSELTEPTSGEDWLANYPTEEEGELAIDMYQTDGEIVVRAPVAGVKPEDIQVSVENGVLTLKGKRHDETEIKEEDYYAKECYWGAFSRSVELPVEVDASKATAEMPEGILTVKIPKLNKSAEKKVSIKIK